MVDWRTKMRLSAYTDITPAPMVEWGIPIIDQVGITDPLHDMAYECIHKTELFATFPANSRLMRSLIPHARAS